MLDIGFAAFGYGTFDLLNERHCIDEFNFGEVSGEDSRSGLIGRVVVENCRRLFVAAADRENDKDDNRSAFIAFIGRLGGWGGARTDARFKERKSERKIITVKLC